LAGAVRPAALGAARPARPRSARRQATGES